MILIFKKLGSVGPVQQNIKLPLPLEFTKYLTQLTVQNWAAKWDLNKE